ncbi:MAG: hypothetical protein R6U68_03905 [Desulfobacteraceae bacterium]
MIFSLAGKKSSVVLVPDRQPLRAALFKKLDDRVTAFILCCVRQDMGVSLEKNGWEKRGEGIFEKIHFSVLTYFMPGGFPGLWVLLQDNMT